MKRTITRQFVAMSILFFLLGETNSVALGAIEENAVSTEGQQVEGDGVVLREVNEFEYVLEGRPDPFLPFLSKDSGRKDEFDDTPDDGDSDKPLTGMRLFEPGQLKLVALLKLGSKNVAMAEDVAGKGYRLDENMPIGRYGVIDRITDEQVEITERYKTKTGRIVTKEIVMRLKKEGDK
ncbi:MAG: pilus assembly protein PilP [Candidatus Electrothrix aestuarii]|uniref:Pilus assembly protein PilP n=1 Tax=Candidatus Electrothrix aestuarii TaxID=3062594 RepID=A0AAU8M1L1_9BACT|nr:pilus assembly protein PilP [Candidatus Electrothrix aestuarii]